MLQHLVLESQAGSFTANTAIEFVLTRTLSEKVLAQSVPFWSKPWSRITTGTRRNNTGRHDLVAVLVSSEDWSSIASVLGCYKWTPQTVWPCRWQLCRRGEHHKRICKARYRSCARDRPKLCRAGSQASASQNGSRIALHVGQSNLRVPQFANGLDWDDAAAVPPCPPGHSVGSLV